MGSGARLCGKTPEDVSRLCYVVLTSAYIICYLDLKGL